MICMCSCLFELCCPAIECLNCCAETDALLHAGSLRMINGKLQSSSIDVYLALEFCEAGDLHALRGQMTPAMVQHLVGQLVAGVQYLHNLQVWHRDLKSANCLLTLHEGVQLLKIADLGSARSGASSERSLQRNDSLIAETAGISMLPADAERFRAAYGPGAGRLTLCAPDATNATAAAVHASFQ